MANYKIEREKNKIEMKKILADDQYNTQAGKLLKKMFKDDNPLERPFANGQITTIKVVNHSFAATKKSWKESKMFYPSRGSLERGGNMRDGIVIRGARLRSDPWTEMAIGVIRISNSKSMIITTDDRKVSNGWLLCATLKDYVN